MELASGFRLLLFGIISLLPSCLLLYECKKLDGYDFPVYSTKSCPRNQTEWNERSSAINCTKDNGYLCLPNENLTELLEFCYQYPYILIQEGICLYLRKKYSKVDSYSCIGFLYGCPNSSFVSYNLFENPQCTTIGNGCFLAEPSCQSLTSTSYPQEATEQITPENKEWILFGTTCGLFIPTCLAFVCFRFINLGKGKRNSRRNIDVEKNKEEHLPLISQNQLDINESCVEGNRNSRRNIDVEKNKEEEHLPLISQNQLDINESCVEEMSLDQIRLEQWQKDDTRFVETKASIEVEKLIQSQNITIVTGNPGSGKTAIVQHVALKYRSQDWTVKPVDTAKDIIEVLSNHTLEKRTIVVLNDPIGKETLDELDYSSWKKQEENLQACLKKIKLLISCRIYILNDNRVKGILKSKSNIIDISCKQLQLSKTEKEDIWHVYASNENVSKDELEKIVQSEAYFPLLCKLYFAKNIKTKDRLKFFTEPIEVFEEEIRDFRTLCKERYCSLVLLVLFNNELCIEDMLEGEISRKKYKNALELCNMKKNTAPHTISDTLKTLQGFFVKKIGDNFQFYHDFVMEVTTYVFGTDYPNDTIQYADIGFLRKRVRIENDKRDQFTIYLSDRYINALGKRLFNDIFGERLLDVVLNPCLNSEKVSQAFIEEMERHPEKLKLLLEKKQNQIDSIDLNQISDNLLLSKLDFFSLEEQISPLNAIIIFCNTNLSFNCLKALQKSTDNLKCNSIFSALCCQGSQELLTVFLKDNLQAYLSEKWNVFSPIHIAAAFHNFEILTELLKTGVDVNLKTDNDKYLTPLTLAAVNYTEEDKEDSESRHIFAVKVLLNYSADVNLCMDNGASPLYVACHGGHGNIVDMLLSNGADINLCTEKGASPLYIACETDYGDIVQRLLNNGADINLSLEDGTNPLLVACQKGHDNTVQHLLNSGADINLCMKNGASPLLIACREGHLSTAKLLLSNEANVNLCMENKTSPLHIACQKGFNDIVKLLLANGAYINSCMVNGESPLYSVCQEGHDSTAQLLLSNDADINLCANTGASPLYISSLNGHNNIVERLLNNGADIDFCTKDGASPLYAACEKGNYITVELLLRNNTNVNLCFKDGASPLFIACQEEHYNTVKLIDKANVNLCKKNGASPLFIACQNGQEPIAKILLSHGADLTLCLENGTNPLFVALQYGHASIVNLLQTYGADINQSITNDNGPLHIACQTGNDSMVQNILRCGANINICVKDGASPLYIASENGHENIVKMLISNKANINLCAQDGSSPLHVACKYGHTDVVKLLLNNGGNINSLKKNTTSALFDACQNGKTSIVRLLLNEGADINLCTRNGVSPLYIACQKGHKSIVQLLIDNKAEINLCKKTRTSPLWIAFKKGHHTISQELIKNGAK